MPSNTARTIEDTAERLELEFGNKFFPRPLLVCLIQYCAVTHSATQPVLVSCAIYGVRFKLIAHLSPS